jgi:hypothetical protein
MSKYINWLLILAGILLVTWFANNLKLPQNRNYATDSSRFYYNPYKKKYSGQLLNDPRYRKAYETSESEWAGPYPQPRKQSLILNTAALTMLLVFGVLGFGVNLFTRAIYLYCEWREGNKVDWKWQAFLTFAIPIVYILAMVEVMAVFGYFRGQ